MARQYVVWEDAQGRPYIAAEVADPWVLAQPELELVTREEMEADFALLIAPVAWEGGFDRRVEAVVADVMADVFLKAAVYGPDSIDPHTRKLMEMTGRSLS